VFCGLAGLAAARLHSAGEQRLREAAVARTGIAVFLAALLLVAGCGGSRTGAKEPKLVLRSFPTLRIEVGPGVDSLDPGLSYAPECWQSLWNVYLSPYGYQHQSGKASAQIVPALADGLPNISGGGRVYEFRLRKGLRYSNGKPVQAADFAYAIRRLYLLDSVGAPLFDDIIGASVAAARRGAISGVQTDDFTRSITVRLKRPSATFMNALASLFAAPVPQSTPSHDQTLEPIPSTGPYEIAQVRWPKEFILTRNRYFQSTETVPATNPDRIVVSVVKDGHAALEQLIAGAADYAAVPIAPASLEQAMRKNRLQLRAYTEASTNYFFMNTTRRPFSDVRVRRAVNYALDRSQLVRIFGGDAVATENILPPVYPSYRRHDLYPYNLAKAKALVRQVRAKGAHVTVFAPTQPVQARAAAAYLERQLAAIGLDPSPTTKLLPPAKYWAAVGSKRTEVQIGYAFWTQSVPGPFAWFEPLLNGDETRGLANTNYSFADSAALNAGIDRLSRAPELTPEVNAQWAALDRRAMRWAPLAPLVNPRSFDALSTRIDLRCYVSNTLYGVDYGRLCLKRGTGTRQ
jgi:peptide/nickel transport system substrate-binding protein